MYQDYFGFERMPFHITPDTRFLYHSPTHQEALVHLSYGIEQKKGFVVLTGEVGCGKTTLSRALMENLHANPGYETALILNPSLKPRELLQAIFTELECLPEANTENSTENFAKTLHLFQEYLIQKALENKTVVVLIDEAQCLPLETLEHLRLLSNMETQDQKLLQIVLIGQPELGSLLNRPQLRQLKQRILVHYELKRFNFQETHTYIQHRIALAQAKTPPQFTLWALRKIYRKSCGIPRIINDLCDKSLLCAYTKNHYYVNYFDVRRAIQALAFC